MGIMGTPLLLLALPSISIVYSNMLTQIVFLALLVASSQAQLTCDECSNIGTLLSDEILKPESIDAEVALILEAICSMAPADEECESKLPSFWALVAADLFSRDYGWFSPSVMCMVECGAAKSPLTGLTCDDCDAKLSSQLTQLGTEESIVAIMDAFHENDWCELHFTGLELVLEVALPIFAADTTGVMDFCQTTVMC